MSRRGATPRAFGGSEDSPNLDSRIESFDRDSDSQWLIRRVRRRDGSVTCSRLRKPSGNGRPGDDPAALYDASWLRASDHPESGDRDDVVTVVDLFSGCGGMSVGVREAARALNLTFDLRFAADTDPTAREVLRENFRNVVPDARSVEDLFGRGEDEPYRTSHRALAEEIGGVDILLGGPPCQGHSNLNNHSRRSDEKNGLYFSMARAAKLLEPDHIIIENVRDIVHDENGVFARTQRYLEEELGYRVDSAVVRAEHLGVPQQRHRMFMVASRVHDISIGAWIEPFQVEERTFDWACADLDATVADAEFDSASRPMKATRSRIDWLFANEAYDLPDELRPPCHRDGNHSYKSVYGRIRPDRPVQTITTGFTYMGQGRFVHPRERRTITPHEAARLQFFPDTFSFGELNRTGYKTLIGNAVPPKLTYVLALQLLR